MVVHKQDIIVWEYLDHSSQPDHEWLPVHEANTLFNHATTALIALDSESFFESW